MGISNQRLKFRPKRIAITFYDSFTGKILGDFAGIGWHLYDPVKMMNGFYRKMATTIIKGMENTYKRDGDLIGRMRVRFLREY